MIQSFFYKYIDYNFVKWAGSLMSTRGSIISYTSRVLLLHMSCPLPFYLLKRHKHHLFLSSNPASIVTIYVFCIFLLTKFDFLWEIAICKCNQVTTMNFSQVRSGNIKSLVLFHFCITLIMIYVIYILACKAKWRNLNWWYVMVMLLFLPMSSYYIAELEYQNRHVYH